MALRLNLEQSSLTFFPLRAPENQKVICGFLMQLWDLKIVTVVERLSLLGGKFDL